MSTIDDLSSLIQTISTNVNQLNQQLTQVNNLIVNNTSSSIGNLCTQLAQKQDKFDELKLKLIKNETNLVNFILIKSNN